MGAKKRVVWVSPKWDSISVWVRSFGSGTLLGGPHVFVSTSCLGGCLRALVHAEIVGFVVVVVAVLVFGVVFVHTFPKFFVLKDQVLEFPEELRIIRDQAVVDGILDQCSFFELVVHLSPEEIDFVGDDPEVGQNSFFRTFGVLHCFDVF